MLAVLVTYDGICETLLFAVFHRFLSVSRALAEDAGVPLLSVVVDGVPEL